MAPVATTEQHQVSASDIQKYDIHEDYKGSYRFAPIEESQVSRAMIKRLVIVFFFQGREISFYFEDTSIRCTSEQCLMSSLLELEVQDYLVHTP